MRAEVTESYSANEKKLRIDILVKPYVDAHSYCLEDRIKHPWKKGVVSYQANERHPSRPMTWVLGNGAESDNSIHQ